MDAVEQGTHDLRRLFGRLAALSGTARRLSSRVDAVIEAANRREAGPASRAETSMATNRVYNVAVIPGDLAPEPGMMVI